MTLPAAAPARNSPPDPVESAARADYLWQVNRCRHGGPRRPGSCCGGCGREWSELLCTTCDLPRDRWDPTDPLFTDGAAQCPDCQRADQEEMEPAA